MYKLSQFFKGASTFKNWYLWVLGRYHLLPQDTYTIRLSNGLSFLVEYPRDSIQFLQEVFMDKVYNQHYEVQHGDIVVDIGAGYGDFALKCADEGATVYAYEADPEIASLLTLNAQANHLEERIHLVTGHVQSDADFSQLPRIDLFKSSCHGGEKDIIAHTKPTTWDKIQHIAMEYRGDASQFIDFLLNNFDVHAVKRQAGICYIYADRKRCRVHYFNVWPNGMPCILCGTSKK